jgi:hypothetical protein
MVYSAVMMMMMIIIIISMVWYDIYLLPLGFHSVAVVGKLVQKQLGDSYVQKPKQYTKQLKSTKCTK